MFSVLPSNNGPLDSGSDCHSVAQFRTPIATVRPLTSRSPAAPPFDLKRQFKFEFNSYLRSALTLRGVSSLYISFADKPRRASVPHPIDERAAAGCALGEMIRLSISAGDRGQFQV
jgi:hypothetical protein